MAEISKKNKEALLNEWRDKNFEEMDRNLAVWKLIREDPSASNKDRIEAAKNIARALAALQPDAVAPKKPEAPKPAEKGAATFEVSKEEEGRIRKLIDGIYH